jgi:hypothetical protein
MGLHLMTTDLLSASPWNSPKVKGGHNWIWFYLMEKSGKLDYQGSLFSAGSLPVVDSGRPPVLMSNRWTWAFENRDYRKSRQSGPKSGESGIKNGDKK